jgi:hypothetical protein
MTGVFYVFGSSQNDLKETIFYNNTKAQTPQRLKPAHPTFLQIIQIPELFTGQATHPTQLQ